MAWTTDKRVCKALYFALQGTDQIDLLTEFEDAGSMVMEDLLFFNSHASEDLRRQEAIILASRFDSQFIKAHRARYEKDVSRPGSIAAMTELMMQAEKTVEELSDIIDACYKFRDEKRKRNEN
ncbi:MAG TPA: hypothetical protein VFP97_13565 [Chitinophagaceae bacterium]|nr:hypothetical protein [Chitinophagaceae bacterium]